MSEQAGSSLKLLTLLKIGVDKYFSISDQTVTGLKQSRVDTKVKKISDLSVKLPDIHKQYGVNGPTFNGDNFRKIEEKLLKFEVARANLEKKAEVDTLAEKNMLQSIQQQKRQDAIQKLKENQQFMQDWERTGKKDWRQNRETRANEIARQMFFEDREIKIYKDQLQRELTFNDTDMRNGVVEFQENLRKLGIEENITIQEAVKRQEEKKGIPPGQIQNFSYAATMNKIKETKNSNEFAGKERDRRNRKMHVDQRKIQQTLDEQKKEEELIQKLLSVQTEEQKISYSNWRNDQCKQIVTQNRIKKSESIEEDKRVRNIEIGRKMQEDADALEDERVLKQVDAKLLAKQSQREAKKKKRHVNVEIASEIMDLIMDVTDEAYDYALSHKGQEEELLTKDIWRDWMNIFTNGEKVSESNIVITKDESVDSSVKESDPLAEMLGQGDPHISPSQILDKIQNEPIFNDFMQYLSMCGPLNLRLVAPNKWNRVQEIVNQQLSDKNIDLGFLNELYAPSDVELGYMIENLYFGGKANEDFRQSMYKTQSASGSIYGGQGATFQSSTKMLKDPSAAAKNMDVIVEEGSAIGIKPTETQIPNWHTLKLCFMGKSLSGKKTNAKMIQDEFGGENVKIFQMDDILRDSLAFIMQQRSPKDEAVADPKGKGGKGAKGATEAPAQMFEGKNTTQYQEIAENIFKQITVAFGSEEIPGKDVDLINLVLDDSLLVNIFIENLKLEFDSPPLPKDDVDKEMRDNLAKKQDLMLQLEEARNNEGVEVDPKAKKAAKATRTVSEIEDEIKALLSIEINGWVLLDFPRTINQSKLLENLLTGYKSITDQEKTYERANFEVWSKLADPEFENRDKFAVDYQAQPSFFDGIFMLNTDRNECMRRAQNRKIDQTTGTVYHAEDNAPPEGDAKLIERLVPYYGNFPSEEEMIQKIDLNHINFEDQDLNLAKFYEEFGVIDQQTGQGNETFHNVQLSHKIDKSVVFQQILTPIQEILNFKNIEKSREYTNLEAIIKAEEEAQRQKDQEEAEPVEEQEKSAAQVDEKTKEDVKSVTKQSYSKQSNGEGSEKGGHLTSGFGLNKSRTTMGKSGSIGKVKRIALTRVQKIRLWEKMIASYLRDGMVTLQDIQKQHETVTDCLNYSQSQFVQFLERSDIKQQHIDEFITSFNQFANEFPDLRKDDQAKDELLQRVRNLSNVLWEDIEIRKNESIQEISKQSEEGWSANELKNVVKNMANLIEIEIKKFSIIYQLLLDQEPPAELDAEFLVKKLLERGTKPYDPSTKQSTILNQVVQNLIAKLDEIFIETQKENTIATEATQQILDQQRKIFTYKLTMINAWGLGILEEISTNSTEVYTLMDDWIVDAVAQENFNARTIIDNLIECVKSECMVINEYQFQIQKIQLDGVLNQKAFSTQQVPMYLQNVHIPDDQSDAKRFNTDHLNQIFKEMKENTGDKGSYDLIDKQSFKNTLMLAHRQGRVPLVWKYMNFNSIEQICSNFNDSPLPCVSFGGEAPTQYQSQLNQTKGMNMTPDRQWIKWKKVMTAFTLLNSRVPNETQLQSLQENLSNAGEGKDYISLEQFVQSSQWFDKVEGVPDQALMNKWKEEATAMAADSDEDSENEEQTNLGGRVDENRLVSIKTLLFNTHRVKTGEDKLHIATYINTLSELSTNQSGNTFVQVLFE